MEEGGDQNYNGEGAYGEPLQQQQMPASIHQQYPGMQYEPVDIDTGMPHHAYQQNR